MLQIAGDDVVGARGLGALQKNIVIGVGTGMHLLGRFDPEAILPNSAVSFSMPWRIFGKSRADGESRAPRRPTTKSSEWLPLLSG
jgi:hypothetical protein